MTRQTHVERPQRVRCTRSLEDIHPVGRIVAVLCHRDVDVESAIDVVQLWSPHIRVPRWRGVHDGARFGPLSEVARARDLDVATGRVE